MEWSYRFKEDCNPPLGRILFIFKRNKLTILLKIEESGAHHGLATEPVHRMTGLVDLYLLHTHMVWVGIYPEWQKI